MPASCKEYRLRERAASRKFPLRYTDSAGKVLTGDKAYTIKFASPPPVDAFWSLTVYNAATSCSSTIQ